MDFLAEHDRTIAERETEARERGGAPDAIRALAAAHLEKAEYLHAFAPPGAALASYEAGIALLATRDEWRAELAKARADLGAAMRAVGRVRDALAQHDLAIEALQALGDAGAGPPLARELALARVDRGADLEGLDLPGGALAEYRRAIEILDGLVAASGVDPEEIDGDRAAAEESAGSLLRRLGRAAESLEAYGRAIDILGRRGDDVDLPRLLGERGSLLHDLRRHDEAAEDHAAAIAVLAPQLAFERETNAVLRKLGGDGSAEIAHALAGARMRRGAALASLERLDEARGEVDGAVAVLEAAAAEGMAYLVGSLLGAVAVRLHLHGRLERWEDAAGDVGLALRVTPDGQRPEELLRVLGSLPADARDAIVARLGDVAPRVESWLAGR